MHWGTTRPYVHLQGIANVAAVDCDEASNKPLCGQYGVQGFPTLKVSGGPPATSLTAPVMVGPQSARPDTFFLCGPAVLCRQGEEPIHQEGGQDALGLQWWVAPPVAQHTVVHALPCGLFSSPHRP